MGFHLKPKNTLLPVEPGGNENVIGIRAFKERKKDIIKEMGRTGF